MTDDPDDYVDDADSERGDYCRCEDSLFGICWSCFSEGLREWFGAPEEDDE